MDNIIWLSEVTSNDLDIVGNKAFKLSELYNLRLPIPQGFILTNDTFKKFLENNRLDKKINSISENIDINNFKLLNSKIDEIKEIMMKAEFSENLKNEIFEAYDNLNVDEQVWRNSNKKALDLVRIGRSLPYLAVKLSSNQKELSTFLNVKGISSLITVIKKSWASLYNLENIYTRVKNNISNEEINGAILIQKMINSNKSGFIVNNLEDNEITIQALYGLSELLTTKSVLPNFYTVDLLKLEIKDKTLNSQPYYLTIGDYGNNVRKENKENTQVLNDNEILDLASLYKRVKDYYNKNIKVEFAVENSRISIINVKGNI